MNTTGDDTHGAGALRSDPKTGNVSDSSAGIGPDRPDQVRILNFVRLVRYR